MTRVGRPGQSDVEWTLMAAIGCGEFAPGAVESAAGLARRYGSSVAAVRKALPALAQDRLIEPVAGRGFRPAEPSFDELCELMDLRRLIEASAARAVAEQGVSDQGLRQLRALAGVTLHTAHDGDVVAYIKADLEFHLFLVGLAGGDQLVEVVRLLRARCRIDKLAYPLEQFMVRNAEEHATLVEMCVVGDTVGTADLLLDHITRPLVHHRDADADGGRRPTWVRSRR